MGRALLVLVSISFVVFKIFTGVIMAVAMVVNFGFLALFIVIA